MANKEKFVFTLTTSELNRNGRKLLLEGLDITNFMKNPVMFYNHDTYSLPIGKWENIKFEYDDNGKPIKLTAEAVFDTQDEQAIKVRDKVKAGMLKAVSIGYKISDYSIEPLVSNGEIIGYINVVKKSDMYEGSIVTVPANPNSLLQDSLIPNNENTHQLFVENSLQVIDNHLSTKTPSKFMKISQTVRQWLGLFPTVDTVQQVEGGLHIAETDIAKVVTDVTKLQAEKDDLSKKLADKENDLKTAKDKLQQSEEDLQEAKDKIAELEDKLAIKSGKPLAKGEDKQPTGDTTNNPKLNYATEDDLD